MIKILTYSALLFSGKPKNYFKNYKNRFNLNELVELHHIIPRQFKKHPAILLSKYEIENGYNFIYLPTYKGSKVLNLHHDRPLHVNGHANYNSYICFVLDNMYKDEIINENNMCEFNIFLRENMRHLNIPWY